MLQKKNSKASSQRTYNVSIILLLLMIGALLVSSCGTADPEIIAKYRDADTKPEGIDEWSCDGVCPHTENGHTLTLLDVPSDVTPYFVPIPDGDKEQLIALNLDTEGFTCVNTIVGNLIFYNNTTQELVTTFEKAITIKLDYTYADLAAVKECGSTLDDKELWNDLVPGYLFISTDDTNVNSWKAFSKYTVEPLEYDATAAPETNAGTISIEFLFWGDRPIIGGSPKE